MRLTRKELSITGTNGEYPIPNKRYHETNQDRSGTESTNMVLMQMQSV